MVSDYGLASIWDRGGIYKHVTWWRHDMETRSALLTLCEGSPPVTDEFPSQKGSNANLGVILLEA